MTEHRTHADGLAAPLTQPFSGMAELPVGVDDAANEAPLAFDARLSHRLARHIRLTSLRMRGGPLVSFTFDDVPDSALAVGAPLLESYEARGTFYIAGGLLSRSTKDWRVIDADGVCALHARGHEIGCHSYTHIRADRTSGAFIAEDVVRNRLFLQAIEPSLRLENFAYPFGYGHFAWKRRLAKSFRSCRSIISGLNTGGMDPHFLRAQPLYSGRIDADGIERMLDATQERSGWLIFYGHDVTQRPSDYGCTPQLLTHALRAAAGRGIACVSVSQALQRIAAI